MRVGVTTFGADGGKSGISQYLINLMQSFASDARDVEFEVSAYADECDIFIPHAQNMSSHIIDGNRRGTMASVLWHQTGLPRLCRQHKYDILFLPAANRRLPAAHPCPTVGTVHDFSILHLREKYDASHLFYITKVLPKLVRRLTRVIAVSESAKRDIVHFAQVPPDRITVIPNAVNHRMFAPGDDAEALRRLQERLPIRAPYVLYVSRLEHPGKNHVGLIEAFGRLKERTKIPHQLVLAGTDWDRADEVHRAAEALRCRDDILFTGFVEQRDVPNLYRAAELMVFPSLAEGFGMPILEAMASGTPVACSNISSMPEVAGGAAALFDPMDSDSIAESIERILSDPTTHSRLRELGIARAAQFTWKQAAASHMEVFRSAWESKGTLPKCDAKEGT